MVLWAVHRVRRGQSKDYELGRVFKKMDNCSNSTNHKLRIPFLVTWRNSELQANTWKKKIFFWLKTSLVTLCFSADPEPMTDTYSYKDYKKDSQPDK